MSMSSQWQPYREPVRATLLRTLTLAVLGGAALAASRGGMRRWPIAMLLMLWPALGGHFVELFFLNWMRPRISPARAAQVTTRILVWFAGGAVLAMGMFLTAPALNAPWNWTWWTSLWLGGLAFIAIELVVHMVLLLRRRPSFYNGEG